MYKWVCGPVMGNALDVKFYFKVTPDSVQINSKMLIYWLSEYNNFIIFQLIYVELYGHQRDIDLCWLVLSLLPLQTLPCSHHNLSSRVKARSHRPDNENENENNKSARPLLVDAPRRKPARLFNQSRVCIFIVLVFVNVIRACVTGP